MQHQTFAGEAVLKPLPLLSILIVFNKPHCRNCRNCCSYEELKCAVFFPHLRLRFFREARGEVELKELNIEPLETWFWDTSKKVFMVILGPIGLMVYDGLYQRRLCQKSSFDIGFFLMCWLTSKSTNIPMVGCWNIGRDHPLEALAARPFFSIVVVGSSQSSKAIQSSSILTESLINWKLFSSYVYINIYMYIYYVFKNVYYIDIHIIFTHIGFLWLHDIYDNNISKLHLSLQNPSTPPGLSYLLVGLW